MRSRPPSSSWRRRAGSIRKREAVGAWLIGVAYRVAGSPRGAVARRRRHEGKAARGPAPSVAQEEPGDWVPLLREEIGRLPDRLRAPLVLCYLEGLTQDEVARRLGWPIGTVRSRLARGRDRLRERLVLRGVAPSVAAIGVASWREAGASVPAPGAAGTDVEGRRGRRDGVGFDGRDGGDAGRRTHSGGAQGHDRDQDQDPRRGLVDGGAARGRHGGRRRSGRYVPGPRAGPGRDREGGAARSRSPPTRSAGAPLFIVTIDVDRGFPRAGK